MVCSPGLAHRRLTPSNYRRAALRRRDVGRERPARPRRLRQQADAARGRGRRAARRARRRPSHVPGRADWVLDRKIEPNHVGFGLVDGTRAYLDSLAVRRARGAADRRDGHQDLPTDFRSGHVALARESDRGAGLPHAAAAQHALHPRHHVLALRRADDEPALLARAQRRDPALQGDLRVPPRLRRVDGLVGRPREGLGTGHVRGRRHDAGGQRRGPDRDERAHLAAGHHPGRARPCSTQGAAEQVVVAGMPKLRAAMHLDTVFTFADRDIVTSTRRSWTGSTRSPCSPRTRHRESRSPTRATGALRRRRRAAPWALLELRVHRDRRRRLRSPSGSSGTAATTRSRSSPAWCSPTTATRYTNTLLRKAGVEVITDRRRRARPRPRWRSLHDLPDHPGPGGLLMVPARRGARRAGRVG